MVKRMRALASHAASPWLPLHYTLVVGGGLFLLGWNLPALAGLYKQFWGEDSSLPKMRAAFGKWDWVANGLGFSLKHIYFYWRIPYLWPAGLGGLGRNLVGDPGREFFPS